MSLELLGKWGLGFPGSEGDPVNQGFDYFFGYNCQRYAHRYYPEYLWDNKEKYFLEGNDWSTTVTMLPMLSNRRPLILSGITRTPLFCLCP